MKAENYHYSFQMVSLITINLKWAVSIKGFVFTYSELFWDMYIYMPLIIKKWPSLVGHFFFKKRICVLYDKTFNVWQITCLKIVWYVYVGILFVFTNLFLLYEMALVVETNQQIINSKPSFLVYMSEEHVLTFNGSWSEIVGT